MRPDEGVAAVATGWIETFSDPVSGGMAKEPSGAISWAWGGLSAVAAENSRWAPAACGSATVFRTDVGAPA